MGRPKTIFVDDAAVLASIVAAYVHDIRFARQERQKALAAHNAAEDSSDRRLFWADYGGWWRTAKDIRRVGIPYDVEAIIGRQLTPSERIRHQEAVRRLIDAGKVEKAGRHIRPVAKGTADA